jgi:hypothetical protein
MLHDPKLTASISELYARLDIRLAQLWGEASGWPDFGDDPMGFVRGIGSIRCDIEASGIAVPPFIDPDVDPIAHMTEWRDFLAKLVTVH